MDPTDAGRDGYDDRDMRELAALARASDPPLVHQSAELISTCSRLVEDGNAVGWSADSWEAARDVIEAASAVRSEVARDPSLAHPMYETLSEAHRIVERIVRDTRADAERRSGGVAPEDSLVDADGSIDYDAVARLTEEARHIAASNDAIIARTPMRDLPDVVDGMHRDTGYPIWSERLTRQASAEVAGRARDAEELLDRRLRELEFFDAIRHDPDALTGKALDDAVCDEFDRRGDSLRELDADIERFRRRARRLERSIGYAEGVSVDDSALRLGGAAPARDLSGIDLTADRSPDIGPRAPVADRDHCGRATPPTSPKRERRIERIGAPGRAEDDEDRADEARGWEPEL